MLCFKVCTQTPCVHAGNGTDHTHFQHRQHASGVTLYQHSIILNVITSKSAGLVSTTRDGATVRKQLATRLVVPKSHVCSRRKKVLDAIPVAKAAFKQHVLAAFKHHLLELHPSGTR